MAVNTDYNMYRSYFGLGMSNPTSLFNSLNQTSGGGSLLITQSGMRVQNMMSKYLNSSGTTNSQKYQQALEDYTEKAKPFYDSFYPKMEALQDSAEALKNTALKSALRPTGYGSENSGVASVVSGVMKDGSNVSIQVDQLATAQSVSIGSVSSAVKNGFSGKSTLSLQTASGTTKEFKIDIDYGKTNKEALQSIASQVNNAKAGVTASIVEKDGKSTLQFASDKTGADQKFTVSGTGKLGAALNTQTITEAQDAIYQVNGQSRTSSTNRIEIPTGATGDAANMKVDLKGTGNTTLKKGTLDASSALRAVKQFASDYNSVSSFLTSKSSVSSAVGSLAFSFSSLRYNSSSLGEIGLSFNTKGQLSVDDKKFTAALQSNPQKVQQMIGSANGLAGSTYTKATNAINNANKLIPTPPSRYGNYAGQGIGLLLDSYA